MFHASGVTANTSPAMILKPASSPRASRLGILLMVVGGVLLFNGAVACYNINKLASAEGWVRHTLQVQQALDAILMGVVGAERAARGYVLTGTRDFIDQYSEAVSDVHNAVAAIEQLTNDNSLQQARIERLRMEMRETLSWSSSLVKARSDGSAQAAQEKISTGRGYELTKNFRALVEEMRNEELSLLMTRTEAADKVRDRTLIVIAALTGMSLVLLPLIAWAMRREVSHAIDGRSGDEWNRRV